MYAVMCQDTVSINLPGTGSCIISTSYVEPLVYLCELRTLDVWPARCLELGTVLTLFVRIDTCVELLVSSAVLTYA